MEVSPLLLAHGSISSLAGRNTQIFSLLAGKCSQYVQGHMHRTASILMIKWVVWDWISSGKGRNWTFLGRFSPL